MASCSATTGSSTVNRRFHRSDAEATCCSTMRNASSGPPMINSRATTAGGRAVTASIEPTPKPMPLQPSWRTRKAVTSRGEWMRCSRVARSSVTPNTAATRSPNARLRGRTTSRNDSTDRSPSRRRRTPRPPGE